MAIGPPAPAEPERGGHVLAGHPPLPPRVLGRHRRELARTLQVGYGGRVPAARHFGPARHPQMRVDDQAAPFQRLPQGFHQRIRADAHAPHEGPGRHELPVGEQHPLMGGLLHRRTHPHVHPPRPQHPVGGAGQPPVHLRQHALRHVQQQPAGPYAVGQRVAARQPVGEQLHVGGHLGAGVSGADHHEGAPGGADLHVVLHGRELHLPGHVVAQVQRLRQPAEPVRVLGDPGDGQQFVDAAHAQHQPVVPEGARTALGVGVVDGAPVQVDVARLAEHQPHPVQGARQRHGDPAGLQDAGGDLGQQRQVQEVVGRVQQCDVGPVAGEARQCAGSPVPGEPGADDHDVRSAHGAPPAV